MFGRGKRPNEGAQAKAVVIATREVRGAVGVGVQEIDALAHPVHYDLDLRVHFDDGSATTAKCRVGGAISGTKLSFSEGDIVPVPRRRKRAHLLLTTKRRRSAGPVTGIKGGWRGNRWGIGPGARTGAICAVSHDLDHFQQRRST